MAEIQGCILRSSLPQISGKKILLKWNAFIPSFIVSSSCITAFRNCFLDGEPWVFFEFKESEFEIKEIDLLPLRFQKRTWFGSKLLSPAKASIISSTGFVCSSSVQVVWVIYLCKITRFASRPDHWASTAQFSWTAYKNLIVFTGLLDYSPEEIRIEAYKSKESGNPNEYVSNLYVTK